MSTPEDQVIAEALALHEHHLRGTPEVVRHLCICLGCQMARALNGEPQLPIKPRKP